MNHSQSCLIKGSFASFSSSSACVLNRVLFYSSIAAPIEAESLGAKYAINLSTELIICLENATTMKITYMVTLFTALPITVGRKNVRNGIWK